MPCPQTGYPILPHCGGPIGDAGSSFQVGGAGAVVAPAVDWNTVDASE